MAWPLTVAVGSPPLRRMYMRGCIKLTMSKLHTPICALSLNTDTHTHSISLPPFPLGGKKEIAGVETRERTEYFLFYIKLT